MQGGPSDRGRTSDSRYRAAKPETTEDFLFHLYRGSELLQDNRVHEAKDELEQALRLQPRDSKGQDLLAVVYFRLGLYPRSIEIYEELIRDFPNDAALSQNLSLCYLKTGQPEKARTLLEHLVLSQPGHLRAWSYLGLVHERLGDYEKARGAFERGQQPGMARRMDELINSSNPSRSLSVPAPLAVPIPSIEGLARSGAAAEAREPEPRTPVEAFHDLDREVTLTGLHTIAPKTSVPPPVAMPTDSPLSPFPSRVPASLDRNGPAVATANEGGTESLPIQPLPYISVGPPLIRTPLPAKPASSDVLPLARMARELLLPFPPEPGLAEHPSGLVLARVQTSFAARLSQVHLLAGDAQGFKAAPLLRRMRNRTLEEPLGGTDAPLVSLAGAGCIALAPAEGERLWAFRMDGDFLFVREAVLAGFEGSVGYENGRLAAFEGEAVALVQLRGKGGVVLRTRGAVVTTEVKADKSAVLARESVLGWAGRLLPRELSPDEAPGRANGLIAFAGDGTVFAGIGTRLVSR